MRRERNRREALTAHRQPLIDAVAAQSAPQVATPNTLQPETVPEPYAGDYIPQPTPVRNRNMELVLRRNELVPTGAGAASLAPPAPLSAAATVENICMNTRGRVRSYEEAFGNLNDGVTSDNHGSATPQTAGSEMDPVAAARREGRAETIQRLIPFVNAATASIDELWAELLRQFR